MNSQLLPLVGWLTACLRPPMTSAWGILLAAALSQSLNGAMGVLRAAPVFDGILLWSDVDAAKAVSGIDLYAVGTNLWRNAEEERAGRFIVRAALDKPSYLIGEPIHLFIYCLHHSTEPTFRPKVGGWEIVQPTVVDHRNLPVPLTPAGEWHASFSNLYVLGFRSFLTNRILIAHIDLTELVALNEPGEYSVFPKILLYPASIDPDLPASVELRAIPFEVTTHRFERPTNAPASVLAALYGQHLNELAGRSPPPTDLERELASKVEQAMKAGLEQDRLFMEAEARKAAAAKPPVPAPEVAVAEPRPEAEAPPHRQPGWPLFIGGAALLAILGWLWRRRDG